MKILLLPQYFYPESYASAHLDNDLYESIAASGNQMVAYSPTPTRGIDLETRKEFLKKRREVFFDGNLIVNRFRLYGEKSGTFLRAIRYFLSVCIQLYKGLFAKDIDIILLVSTPPIIGLVGGLLHKIKRIPFVYVVQDIFPDSLVNSGITKKGSLAWKFGRVIENYTYKTATKIVVISDEFKNNLLDKNVPDDKIKIIPNWIDSTKVFPVPRESNLLFSKLNLDPNKFYITYCGNIGHTQNLELILSAAKRLQYIPDICIVLFGEGAFLNSLLEQVQTMELKNIYHFPFQAYSDIASVFSLGDAGLIISKSGISTNSVPSKTWSIMAAARPVLASFDLESTLDTVISEANCGIIVPADDEDALYNAIIKLFNNRDSLSELGNNGREYVKTKLNKELCTKKYIEVIEEVTRI